MASPYLGQISIVGFNFAPKGWALCNGQLMAIAQNQALFSILGTTYGGNGINTFALPNLQGRMPVHFNSNTIQLGQSGGEAAHTLIQSEIPSHTHLLKGHASAADQGTPAGNFFGTGNQAAYDSATNAIMNPSAIATVGSSQPHNNMPPYTVVNFVIALQGIFPSRN